MAVQMLMISLADGRRASASRLMREASVAISLVGIICAVDELVLGVEEGPPLSETTMPANSCTSSDTEGGIAALGMKLLLVAVANSEEAKEDPEVRRPDASHLGGLYSRNGTTWAIAMGEHTSARLSVRDADLEVERADV
eukprot:GFYU01054864.1.p2 GENE.GFYU01054864.1~~GFYU01054864.1.p2  ORF type:complete len:140 (-),score=0.92 GFYU01054864.1:73-492(-)